LASIIFLAAISNTTAISDSSIGDPRLSSDPLLIYEQYYDLNQGEVYASGPMQFEIYGSEPSYLIIDGQSRPYDSNYVPSNSLWIQGRTSWTQYIKCPLGARFKMLAYSDGGSTTMIETYPDGYQDVQQYRFYGDTPNWSSWPMRSGGTPWYSMAMAGRAMKLWLML